MEPSFIATPYVMSRPPSSAQVRAILDREAAEYAIKWSRLKSPTALFKVNSPSPRSHTSKHLEPSSSFLSRKLQDHTNNVESSPGRSKANLSSQSRQTERVSTPLSLSASTPVLAMSQEQVVNSSSQHKTLPQGTTTSKTRTSRSTVLTHTRARIVENKLTTPSRTSLVKRKLQKDLYAFHTNVVFSFAANENETTDQQDRSKEASEHQSPRQDKVSPTVSMALPPSCFLVEGLLLLTTTQFDNIFEHDWAASDVEKMVRDVVERKRIYATLKSNYRSVLLYIRYYAGKVTHGRGDSAPTITPVPSIPPTTIFPSEPTAATPPSPPHPSHVVGDATSARTDHFHIPSSFAFLHDLNVDYSKALKFDLTDTPLRRKHLVNFLINVARMVAAHVVDPSKSRLHHAEGIELSEAVKTIIYDHVLVQCAQIQDPNHFRHVFLYKHEVEARQTNLGIAITSSIQLPVRQPRRLPEILKYHDSNLKKFFEESISEATLLAIGTATASSLKSRSRAATPIPATIKPKRTLSFAGFLDALENIRLVTSSETPHHAGGRRRCGITSPDRGMAMIDDSRALSIFLSCLDISVEFDGPIATRELTFPQFVEALLRVVLVRRETSICRGKVDDCPSQALSSTCACVLATCSTLHDQYDFTAFDDGFDEFCREIHKHLTSQARKQTKRL